MFNSSKRKIRRYHRRKHAILISVVCILLFVAFLLLLLVAISLPIVKSVYLMSLKSTAQVIVPSSVATEIRFGVWGYCATSVLNTPTAFNNDGKCSDPRLGYQIDDSILAITGQTALVEVALKGLIVVLILHPISAGLALISLFCAMLSYSHTFAICALVWNIAAALLATVSAAADLALVRVAMAKVNSILDLRFEILWGNAPWMSVAAVGLLWIVIIIQSATLCGCCGVSRRLWTRPDELEDAIHEMDQNGQTKVTVKEVR